MLYGDGSVFDSRKLIETVTRVFLNKLIDSYKKVVIYMWVRCAVQQLKLYSFPATRALRSASKHVLPAAWLTLGELPLKSG